MKGRTPGCWEPWHDATNEATYDYQMYPSKYRNPGSRNCVNSSLAKPCSSYGRFDADLVRKESFLQGRGQITAPQCPEGEVIYLPDAVFADSPEEKRQKEEYRQCQVNTLTSQHTRAAGKGCANVSEMQSDHWNMPGAYQKGYMGFDAFGDRWMNNQDREQGRVAVSNSRGSAPQCGPARR
jgi:hypothetical protein